MKKGFLYFVFIAFLLSVLVTASISFGNTSVNAQQGPPFAPGGGGNNNNQGLPQGPPERYPLPFEQFPFAQARNFSFGPIASIQNNESGQPTWVVFGFWRGNLLSFNETTMSTAGNSEGNNTSSPMAAARFNANLRMIMINGSGEHTHVITNFVLSNVSSNENGTMTYIGNSTISMPDAPIVDVPTTIKISGKIISIFPDPSKVNHHFGNTPIYGAVAREEEQGGLRHPPPLNQPPMP
jgi:hypothetical protein